MKLSVLRLPRLASAAVFTLLGLVAIFAPMATAQTATHLSVTGPDPVGSYNTYTFTITALDASNNVATSYNGTVALTSSDPGFVNLGPLTLSNGQGLINGVFKTAGTETLTATDTSNSSLTGTGSFTVVPGPPVRINIGTPAAVVQGMAFQFNVSVSDLYGNIVTAYTGTVTFSSTDPAAAVPAPATLTNGVGTFTATLNTVGTQTLIGQDASNGISGQSANISVAADSAGFAGGTNVGSSSDPEPATLFFTRNLTLYSIQALTLGVSNQDFAIVEGGSCAPGVQYVNGDSCTVNVVFTPRYPGLRSGAVILKDTKNQVAATEPVFGVGVSPLLGYAGAGQTAALPQTYLGLGIPASDVLGNLYVPDSTAGAVYKVTLGGVKTALTSGIACPNAAAVDGTGNVYVASSCSSGYFKVSPAGVATLFNAPNNVQDLAFDGAGNLYLAVNLGGGIIKIAPNGTQSQIGSGIAVPQALAVDGTGNVYVADFSQGQVFKITPSNTQTAIPGSPAFEHPAGVAVDAAGDLYVADAGTAKVWMITPGGTQSVIFDAVASGYRSVVNGLRIDQWGTLYIPTQTSGGSFALAKIDRHTPATLSFPTVTAGGSNDSTDGPQQITVTNLGNAALTFDSLVYPKDFPESAAGASDCTLAASVEAGATCTLTADFTPVSVSGANTSIALNEAVKYISNDRNGLYKYGSTTLTGTETKLPVTVTLTTKTAVTESNVPIIATVTVSGAGSITGTVQFYSDGVLLPAWSAVSSSPVIYPMRIPVGTHLLTAKYSGSHSNASGTSNAVTITSNVP